MEKRFLKQRNDPPGTKAGQSPHRKWAAKEGERQKKLRFEDTSSKRGKVSGRNNSAGSRRGSREEAERAQAVRKEVPVYRSREKRRKPF